MGRGNLWACMGAAGLQAGLAESALQQLRGAHQELAAAQAQMRSSAAHATALEAQLKQARSRRTGTGCPTPAGGCLGYDRS